MFFCSTASFSLICKRITYSSQGLYQGLSSLIDWFSPKVQLNGQEVNALPVLVNAPDTEGYGQTMAKVLDQAPSHLALGLVLWLIGKEWYHALIGQTQEVRRAKVEEVEAQRLKELRQYGHNPYAKVYLETLYKIEIGLGDEEDFTQAIVQLANQHESTLITLLALALLNTQDKAEAALKELPQDLQSVLECWSKEAYRVVAQLPKASDYLDKSFKLLAGTADKKRVVPIFNKASRYHGLFKTEAITKITPLMSKHPYFLSQMITANRYY